MFPIFQKSCFWLSGSIHSLSKSMGKAIEDFFASFSISFVDFNGSRIKPSLFIPSLTKWPSHVVGHGHALRNRGAKENKTKASIVHKSSIQNIYPPEVREDGKLHFQWTAKMDPSKMNLYRTTSPTFLEYGTSKVTIPSHILLHGVENRKEYIIEQFYRYSTPSGGLIHVVVNRIWGIKFRIFTQKLGESSYLFHIPDEYTRSWIL